MRETRLWQFVIWTTVFYVATLGSCTTSQTLDEVAAIVEKKYPVQEIREAALADSLKADRDRFVLFDVREPEEFAVSRLSGAVRVDPEIDGKAFVKQHAAKLDGKTAVFYCSVGYRSSVLVDRLVEATGDTSRLVNLRGGIFNWHVSGNPVYNADGETGRVHPYDAVWGRFLKRTDE